MDDVELTGEARNSGGRKGPVGSVSMVGKRGFWLWHSVAGESSAIRKSLNRF